MVLIFQFELNQTFKSLEITNVLIGSIWKQIQNEYLGTKFFSK